MPEPKVAGANITFKLSPETTARMDRLIDRLTTSNVLGVHRPSRIDVVRRAIDMFLEEHGDPRPEEMLAGPDAASGAGNPETGTPADDEPGAEPGEGAQTAGIDADSAGR